MSISFKKSARKKYFFTFLSKKIKFLHAERLHFVTILQKIISICLNEQITDFAIEKYIAHHRKLRKKMKIFNPFLVIVPIWGHWAVFFFKYSSSIVVRLVDGNKQR